ncbi:unnamed protein product [Sympodiomycopsis kandeliae]
MPIISVWLLVVLLAITPASSLAQQQQQQQQHYNDDNSSIGHSEIHPSTTPQQAYTQALSLLRSVIDPTALSKHHQHIQRSTYYQNVDVDNITASTKDSQSTPPTSQQQQTNTRGSRMQRQQQRSRTTLADLSPYFNLLTSWGPIGTAMRLTHRINNHLAVFVAKVRTFLSMGTQAPLRVTFVKRSKKNAASSPPFSDAQRARKWPGETSAALWPEWEFDLGHTSLHGPFLIPTQNNELEVSSRQSSSISHSDRLIEYVCNAIKAAFFNASPSASHHDDSQNSAAQGRRQQALSLLQYAANPPSPHKPSADALWVLSQHHILGTHAVQPQPWLAFPLLTRLVETVDVGNASAHHLLSWLYSSGELWKAWNGTDHSQFFASEQYPAEHQSKALLHLTFAAQQGDYPAQMALAYRNLVGIATPPDCMEALRWYERAATQSHIRFKQGPVGGLSPPYTHVRLSDLAGGIYGPGASAASTGWQARRPAIQAALNSLPSAASAYSPDASDPARLSDLLEFYAYHASGGSLTYTLRLAQIYYQGSIYGTSESAGRVRRDYAKARELALRITRRIWPVEIANLKMANGKRVIKDTAAMTATQTASALRGGKKSAAPKNEPDEDLILQEDPIVMIQAGAAAALLGNMYLRGEGVPEDAQKAWFWFWRGAELSDPDCQYGFGLMRSQGLAPDQWRKKDGKVSKKGENVDMKRAVDMWEKAVKGNGAAGHAGASAALGNVHLEMGDLPSAGVHFAAAVTSGSPFEGFYGLGLVNARIYKQSISTLNPSGGNEMRCRAAVGFLKHAAERGDWESPAFHRGLRAWELGDQKRAILYWSMAAERGDEAAQNNLAWILDRDKKRWKISRLDGAEDKSADRLALMYWTRSAAQDNVDALVKLGDYYYHGIGTSSNHTTSEESLSGPDYEKALACYASAADRQSSALAFWNMGHLYESGLGVPRRDFHLAKRYYDRAMEINSEASFPVMLSLIRLHWKALWATVWRQEESAVALFSSYAVGTGGEAGTGRGVGYTEAEEEMVRMQREGGGETDHQNREEISHDEGYDDGEILGDFNLPETYDLRRRKQPQQPQPQQPKQQQQQQPRQDNGQETTSDSNTQSGISLSDAEADAMIDGAMIVIGLSALAMLVYARQAARNRAEQERREEERRRGAAGQEGQGAGAPNPNPYAGGLPWPPDANQFAGL